MNTITYERKGKPCTIEFAAKDYFAVIHHKQPGVSFSSNIWEAMRIYRQAYHHGDKKVLLADRTGRTFLVVGDTITAAGERLQASATKLPEKIERQVQAAMSFSDKYPIEADELIRATYSKTELNVTSAWDVLNQVLFTSAARMTYLDPRLKADDLMKHAERFFKKHDIQEFCALPIHQKQEILAGSNLPFAVRATIFDACKDIVAVVYYPDLAAGMVINTQWAEWFIDILRRKRHMTSYAGASGLAEHMHGYIKSVCDVNHKERESEV